MTRSVVEKPVSTSNARSKLEPGTYWREINKGTHLGYRKGKRAGTWLVRWYDGAGRYRQSALGAADDGVAADGSLTLTFEQAKRAASDYFEKVRRDEKAAADGEAPTVRSAVNGYLTGRDKREVERAGEKGVRRDARLRLTKHVLSATLADIALHELTRADLIGWQKALPDNLAPSTVQRLKNDLRAALNASATENHARLPAEIFVTIKIGLASREETEVVSRVDQALSDADVRRVIDVAAHVDTEDRWDGDLLRMVLVLAATGARFSQAKRLLVSDVQSDRIMVPTSRKGRGRKKKSHVGVRVGSDVIAQLRLVTAGRKGSHPLLERWRHKQVAAENGALPSWERDSRGPWWSSSELTRPWKQIAGRAGLSSDVVAYSLRHSSIVRMLRAGLPIRLVAEVHDTSTKIIESNYASAVVSVMDDLVAGTVIPLAPAADDNVVQLRKST